MEITKEISLSIQKRIILELDEVVYKIYGPLDSTIESNLYNIWTNINFPIRDYVKYQINEINNHKTDIF